MSRPIRVLWLNSSPALGAEFVGNRPTEGGGWVGALEETLKQLGGIRLSVAFPWDVDEVRQIAVGSHEYLPFPRYPRGGRLRRMLHDMSCQLEPLRELRHLDRVVSLTRPDLIHVWGTEPFFGLLAGRVDAPVLIDIQGPRTPYVASYCAGLSKLDLARYGSPKRLATGRSLLHQFYRYRTSARREQRMLLKVRFVCGRTDWDRSICGDLAPNARYFHCDRILRPPFYASRWSRRPQIDTLRIVSTVRGNAYKGIETVAQCSTLLRTLLPMPFQWTLVGIRPGEEIHRIVERKMGVPFERLGIRLTGRKRAGDVASELLENDLYVLPSLIENSPNGLCEAMMLGLPTVATNSGGTPSMVSHQHEGLLVPPGDPAAMASAIQSLTLDPSLGDRLGSAAHDRARRRHDREAIGKTMVSIYREVLATEPCSSGTR